MSFKKLNFFLTTLYVMFSRLQHGSLGTYIVFDHVSDHTTVPDTTTELAQENLDLSPLIRNGKKIDGIHVLLVMHSKAVNHVCKALKVQLMHGRYFIVQQAYCVKE